jgi:uncharacterized protein YbaR (Trm112 family)
MIIVCPACRHALRVSNSESCRYLIGEASEYWPNDYPCFNCKKKCLGCHEPELAAEVAHSLTFHNVTPEEAFAAINGLGLPEERNCVEEVVQEVFKKQSIRAVVGHQHPGQTRFYVNWFELGDGTKVYLSASPQGACIHRIVKPHSYTDSVLKDG